MSPKTNQPSSSKARILIVDDDASQRSLLNSFLNGQGFETVPVSSGERALEVLGEQEVAMMISDVRMPGISGLETLHRLRKVRPTLPVLLVTAYADIRDAVVAMRDGAVNYLEKPIDLDELLASVRNAVGLEGAVAPKLTEDRPLPDAVVARSPLMQAVFRDTSLVASSETRILLTGDIELEGQANLLADNEDLSADVLKVPHHGSRYSLPRFLERVRPRVAMVSVGAGNPFGHPSPMIVDALKREGATVLRTDEDGDVAVVASRDGPLIARRGSPRVVHR